MKAEIKVRMRKNCFICGAFLSTTKPGVTIIEVSEEFRRNRPDVPKQKYLCPKEKCSKQIEAIKTLSWYAGHRIV